MDSVLRAQGRIGSRTLLITSAALPLTGWAIHAAALHKQLAATRKFPVKSTCWASRCLGDPAGRPSGRLAGQPVRHGNYSGRVRTHLGLSPRGPDT